MSAININKNNFQNEVMHSDKPVLLDVRTAEEYRGGHIPGSKNVPLQAIDKVASVAENKDTALFVYCIGGIAAYAGKVEV